MVVLILKTIHIKDVQKAAYIESKVVGFKVLRIQWVTHSMEQKKVMASAFLRF